MTILRNTFLLYRRCFLQLIAIYLFGWLVRYGIVQLAVAVATKYGMLWGNFLLPLSPLTMLLTYLGMFWVLRRHILPDATETGVQAFLNTALQIVLPAFAIFVFWKLHLHDERDYQFGTRLGLKYLRDTSVLPTDIEAKQRLLAEQSHLVHPSTTALLLIVLALLAVRRLLTALATRLPTWTIPARLYVEAAWVYIVSVASAAAIFASPEWISERRVVVWYRHQKQVIFEHLGPIADAINWVTDHTAGVSLALLAPLSWFVIAGLAYSRENTSTWADASKAVLGPTRHEQAVRITRKSVAAVTSRWQSLPSSLRSRSDEFRSGILGTFDHVRDALRLVLQTGALPFAFYTTLFAILVLLYPTDTFFDAQITDGALWRGLAHLFGPHEWTWWTAREGTIRLFFGALVEPIRICLIAGMFWYCIQRAGQLSINRAIDLSLPDSPKETSTPSG
ncbi:hypothetical protein [Mycobacteroides chelonae]|uniref:hypothetical protein n=1 Tax=Mycobacteroides chelonae TaxID=1774 RepID=UPI0008A89456|nr:hypothetical protein [Mycobacteroides chelonae]OHU61608.1 hypothetical protein BKG85_21690 [Mycobacteroides chelonae]